MLALWLLNAEKVHSSESIHVSLRTNGALVFDREDSGRRWRDWGYADLEKDTLRTVRNQSRATVIMVCFQNVSSSDVLLMTAVKTLHPTKYILASCQVNKVPIDQVPITYCVLF